MIFCFLYQLDLNIDNVHEVSKLFLYDNLLVEYFAALFVLTLLIGNSRLYTLSGIMIFVFYVLVNISQLISFFISERFLTRLALDDIAFIGMLFNLENISAILFLLCLLVLIPSAISYCLSKRIDFDRIISNRRFLLLIVLLIVVVNSRKLLLPKTILKDRSRLLEYNYFKRIAPLRSFFEIIVTGGYKKISFSSSEIKQLKELGFDINPSAPFPLLKDNIYKESIERIKSDAKQPNVIVIFAEGFSSRTCAPYNGKFDDLTPNIKLMAEDGATLIVTDYYNHTAATYRGLHGQLCSLYPAFGGAHKERWLKKETVYKSLPEVLNHNGFDTIWLETNYENIWYISKMLSHFGIDKILSAEELSRHVGGLNKLNEVFLTDHQAYSALVGFLKESDDSKPFFLGIYTGETHAWVEVASDGIKYKSGSNNSLNTIHNMDHAFGKFWKYFKGSKYAENTILIFTSDHAHFYPKQYVEAMKQYGETDYRKVFIDKVPLLIYDPVHKLPKTLDANSSTSLDLAPTIIQMLGLPNEPNSFLGTALFDKCKDLCNKDGDVLNREDLLNDGVGVASFSTEYFIMKNDKIFDEFNVLEEDRSTLVLVKKFMNYLHTLEIANRIYPVK
jgi:phosphoglycerol transferase MdoB-like AlkP superfamily enzyme